MFDPSDYERVKMNTYDAIFECETMDELGEALDAIYEDGFDDILIDEDEDGDYEYSEDDEFDDDEEEYDEEIDEDECANCNRRDECLHYKQRGR